MKGIEHLTSALILAADFANQTKEASEGGFKPSDLFGYIDEVMRVQGVLTSKTEIIEELNDLTIEERGQLIESVKAELNVENDKAEEIVGAGLDFLAASYKLVKTVTA